MISPSRNLGYPALADVASAYTMSFVTLLLLPEFTFPELQNESFTFNVILLGGLISSFLFVVDPVNRAVRLPLRHLLKRSHKRKNWAISLASILSPYFQNETNDGTKALVDMARNTFWTPYLAKARAQLTGSAAFVIAFGGLTLYLARRSELALAAMFLIATIATTVVLIWDLFKRIPLQCWTVAMYMAIIDFTTIKPDNLNPIMQNLVDSNWEEATHRMANYLLPPKVKDEKASAK